MNENKIEMTLADVLSLLDESGLTGTRRRDMVSAIKRFCEMAGIMPANVPAKPPQLRELLSRIRPAAHGRSSSPLATSRAPPIFPEASILLAIHRRAVRSDTPVSRTMSRARRYSEPFVIRDPLVCVCWYRQVQARRWQIQRQLDVPVGAQARSAHLPL